MLSKIEKKMLAKYQPANAQNAGSGGFILSDGSIVPTLHHAMLCRTIRLRLSIVIQAGICRFMLHKGKEDGVAAFEYADTKLTTKQKTTIRRLLRANDYYTVITIKNTVSKFRPIRNIKF